VCGSNGPPGRLYLDETQLSNCGNSSGGRMPLVAMNEFALSPVCALSGRLNMSVSESNGVSVPRTSKMLSSLRPAAKLNRNEPNQYSSTSPCVSPEPCRTRQRRGSVPGGSALHCAFAAVGSYS
jgi:hypothetical protein